MNAKQATKPDISDILKHLSSSEIKNLIEKAQRLISERENSPDLFAFPVCPHCHSEKTRPNGSVKGKKRYVCVSCGRSFGATTGTLRFYSHESGATWERFAQCMVAGTTISTISFMCKISLSTAHAWKTKALAFSRKLNAGKKFSRLTGGRDLLSFFL